MQLMARDRSRYEHICLLGEGGMAEVYLGFFRSHANVSKLVVLKQIRSELARDKRFVTMFLDEARLAARLNHPNVVHTYDVLQEGDKYILTMEYLEGQSFFDVLQRIELQYFPLEEHLWILTQVLAGLHYAHSLADFDGSPLGVVHRDVSPANTFVTYDGDVKLLDFGIAKAGGAVSVTQKGTFKGKLNYCAPEQIEATDAPDARADIFAVGVMLWEALAGQRIEADGGYAELAHTRLMGKEPRIRQIRSDVPAALAEICDRAMALKPADRYLSAADFQRDLERYLERLRRRVGRTQVAELMRGHFQTERREMQKRIKAYLRTTNETASASGELPTDVDAVHAELVPTGVRPAPADKAVEWTPVPTEPAMHPPAGFEASAENASSTATPEQPKPSSLSAPIALSGPPPTHVRGSGQPKRLLTTGGLALVAALVAFAAAAIGFWQRGPQRQLGAAGSTPAAPSSALPAQPTAPPSPVVPGGNVAANAPANDTIRLDVTVLPAEANLTLDGKAMAGNRLQADVPRDRKVHTIRAVAAGFGPFSQDIVFSSDVQLTVQLRAEPRPPVAAPLRRAKAASRASAGKLKPRRTAAEAASPAPEPAAARPSSKPLDETNPYAP